MRRAVGACHAVLEAYDHQVDRSTAFPYGADGKEAIRPLKLYVELPYTSDRMYGYLPYTSDTLYGYYPYIVSVAKLPLGDIAGLISEVGPRLI